MMETEVGTLRERAQQLKEKRPGYGEVLDFYVKVREAQITSKASLVKDLVRPDKKRDAGISDGNLSLIEKEDFPVDIDAAISLFHALCRIATGANTRLAEEVKNIGKALGGDRVGLKRLITGEEKGQTQVLSFLVGNSIKPSIEKAMEQLSSEIEPETWRKSHCPVCGSPPSLNLLKGEGGKRYSLCSYCGCQWRIDRLSCAVCGNKEQGSLGYFCAEGEEACRIDFCDTCRHYIKTIDCRDLETPDPALEDLATLHLDIVAVQKGYTRPVPNPWST